MDIRYQESETPTVVQALLSALVPSSTGATVVALDGDLGAGKTTLTKEICKQLGIESEVTSPTFVLARWYEAQHVSWKQVVHIDAYRIESLDELAPLHWDTIIAQPQTLVIVEWPEHIRAVLPPDTKWFHIEHHDTERHITSI